MTVTLPLPLPPADIDRRSSRALSSAVGFRSKPRIVEAPPVAAFQYPFSHIHSGAWRTSTAKETFKHLVPSKPFGDAAGSDKNSIKERNHTGKHRNKLKSKGIPSKRKDAIQPTRNHHPNSPEFTVNRPESKHRIKPSNHSAVVKHTAQTYIYLERSKSTPAHIPALAHTIIRDRRIAGQQAGGWDDRQTNVNAYMDKHGSHTSTKPAEHHQEKHREEIKHSGKSDQLDKEQQAVKKTPKELRQHHNLFEDPSKAMKNPEEKAESKPKESIKKDDSGWCRSFKEQDFADSDHRRIRVSTNLQPLTWFSKDDIQKMELLAGGQVVSKARVPAHGQVLQVHGAGQRLQTTHSERCQHGHCSLIKRTDDWFEVFAFHLDRVLGLNRSLPAVLRNFHSEVLPYRYISGTPRPAVWWDPDIQHLAEKDNDQNSVQLTWVQYQKLLQARCGSHTDQRSAHCVGVQHSEWGRLALFDFLLQINDRLDRCCCGFIPDLTELCVENLLHAKCGNTKDLKLVHILVRKADPSRLVFIDNAGRPQQSTDNLNFRLVEGIDEFPEKAVSVLHSGCLENLLLRSLYTDREFWDSHGGAGGLRPLIQVVQQRGNILLQHIRDKKLRLKRDL
uniref:Golgi associated kinase 1A n=1 Tax=Acanthochromis polyacanthus TaxID=80966 RepID=A0A3Q1F433_9TELE